MTEIPSEHNSRLLAFADNRWTILFFSVLSMVAVATCSTVGRCLLGRCRSTWEWMLRWCR